MVNLTSRLNPGLNFSILMGCSVLVSSVIGSVVAPTIAHAEPTPGQNGRSGESKAIFLPKPERIQLDLSGTDGVAGYSYSSGNGVIPTLIGGLVSSVLPKPHPHEHKPHDPHHQTGDNTGKQADGAAGRNGGNGGNGGDGGSLTVYYQDLSDLKNISVISKPGQGAPGGYGETGHPGKICAHHPEKSEGHRPDRKHDKKQDKKPDEKSSCTDGNKGANGHDGSRGKDGSIGQLFLIKGQQQIAGDVPRANGSLAAFLNTPQALSLNRWESKPGALGLLAQGSVIHPIYQEYRDRLEKTAKVTWNAKANVADYSGQTARLSLQNNGAIDVAFDDSQLWTVVQQSEAPAKPSDKPNDKPTTLVAINSIIHQREVTQLTPGITDKRDRAFTLNIIDTAGKSDLLETTFNVRVRSIGSNGRWGGFSNSTTQYEGAVPANLVTRDYNRFVLNLGGLPVESDVFKAGAELEVEITATRSLGSRSTQKTIDWSGTVY